jgi:hypothetical protein
MPLAVANQLFVSVIPSDAIAKANNLFIPAIPLDAISRS